MRAFFKHWWLSPLLFAAILGGVYAYEFMRAPEANDANRIPVVPLLIILLGLLVLLVSVVYQLTQRSWWPAAVNAAILVWAVRFLFR